MKKSKPRIMQQIWPVTLALLILAGCVRTLVPVQYHAEERWMNDSLKQQDQQVEAIIKPYRDSMMIEMNEVIGRCAGTFTKKQPESSLGNLLADMELEQARLVTQQPVDFAIINYGGIRIPQLPEGPITVGKVYELMPFDNLLVVVSIDGSMTRMLFQRMAEAGGIPIAGARYRISEDKAQDILIDGVPLDTTKFYRVALSDYLANGGDKLEMLKGRPRTETNVLLRDVFLAAIREKQQKGESLTPKTDGRVTR